MKKFLKNTINIICILIIIFSGYNIFTKINEYKKADDVYSSIKEIKEAAPSNEHDSEDSTNISKKMLAINPDYKCWITVDGTNIDYPVVQGNNNDFYLNHDFNKNYLPAGSIFMDYKNNFTQDFNTVIYGHHMRNSTMFGQLEKFKKEDFFNENKYITLLSEDRESKYEIFAIGVFSADYGYNKVNFSDSTDCEAFLEKIQKDCLFYRDIVSANDKILTLSTCSYEFDNARIGVFAKLIN